MPYDPQRHHRRSIRLPGYDYTTPGAYYITICVAKRALSYGRILDGTIVLNSLGSVVAVVWRSLPKHFRLVSLDAWVLMPDHLHGIIVLHEGLPVDNSNA